MKQSIERSTPNFIDASICKTFSFHGTRGEGESNRIGFRLNPFPPRKGNLTGTITGPSNVYPYGKPIHPLSSPLLGWKPSFRPFDRPRASSIFPVRVAPHRCIDRCKRWREQVVVWCGVGKRVQLRCWLRAPFLQDTYWYWGILIGACTRFTCLTKGRRVRLPI